VAEIPILDIKGVGKTYTLGDQRIEALRDANLTIKKGEFVCLIGASGCGKSTLLRIVAGFEKPTAGDALMWDKPIGEPGPDRGMVFQDYGLFPWLTVRENIGFGPASRGLGKAEVRDVVERFVSLVGLTRFADAYPHQLSGGMKQRVAIARVLANDAEVVLMDEPFGALDAMTRERLQDELLELWQRTGLTVFMVTHDLSEAFALANRVLVLDRPRLDPHEPGRFGATITYDIPVAPRDIAAVPISIANKWRKSA